MHNSKGQYSTVHFSLYYTKYRFNLIKMIFIFVYPRTMFLPLNHQQYLSAKIKGLKYFFNKWLKIMGEQRYK